MQQHHNPIIKGQEIKRFKDDPKIRTLRLEVKINITNLLKALVERMDGISEQMGNFSWEVETIGKCQMEMLEIRKKPNKQ